MTWQYKILSLLSFYKRGFSSFFDFVFSAITPYVIIFCVNPPALRYGLLFSKILVVFAFFFLINPSSAQIEFEEHTISDDFDGVTSVYPIDLDSDDDMDIVGAAYYDDEISWWENDGDMNFEEHAIGTDFGQPFGVYAIDLDSDNDIDVLGACREDHSIAWWENDGDQEFVEHTIDDNFGSAKTVYAADINGDGNVDVIGAGGSSIKYWQNEGNGDFEENTIRNNFTEAWTVYAEDVDGDDDLDIIGGALGGDNITWWENDGDNNPDFEEHLVADNFDGAINVFVADVDLDGDMDILGAAHSTDNIKWWENDGDQDFDEHVVTDNYTLCRFVRTVDFDLDGDIDIVGGANATVNVWENIGDQEWTDHIIVNNYGTAICVIPADMDGDGDIDLVSASYDLDEITWWESATNNRPGEFSLLNPQNESTITVDFIRLNWEETVEPEEGDSVIYYVLWWAIDNEFTENLDSVRVAGTYYHLEYLEDDQTYWWKVRAQDTNSRGTWSDETWSFEIYTPQPPRGPGLIFNETTIDRLTWPYSVMAIDMDADGDLDIVGESHGSDEILWWENDDGTFTEHEVGFHDGPRTVDAADIDCDGDIDIVAGGDDDNGVILYINDGGEEFDTLAIIPPGGSIYKINAVDMDGDGDFDIVSNTSSNNNTIVWAENDGNLNFRNRTIGEDTYETILPVDLDQDGDMDVLAGNTNDDEIVLFENDGDQHFDAVVLVDEDLDYPRDLFQVDLDEDGDIDILVAEAHEDQVLWFENDGELNFTSHIIADEFDWTHSVFAADIDDDGDFDILASATFGDEVTWWENDGAENFTEHILTEELENAWGVFARDIDGDGDIDLLCAGHSDNVIKMWSQEHPFHLSTPENQEIIDTFAVTLSWEEVIDPDPDDEIVYEILWANNEELTENLDSTTITDTTFELTGLINLETYWWTVHAQDTNTDGLFAADTFSFTIDFPDPPEDFSLLSPGNDITVSHDFTTLTWEEAIEPDEGDSILFYSVWWATNEDFRENFDTIRVAETTFLFENLEDDQLYWWKVRAQDGNTDGTWSLNTSIFHVYIPDLPGEFSLFYPEDNAEINEDTVLVSWTRSVDNDPGDSITYEVEWSLDEDFETSMTVNTTDTLYLIGGLEHVMTTLEATGAHRNVKSTDNTANRKSLNNQKRNGRLTTPGMRESGKLVPQSDVDILQKSVFKEAKSQKGQDNENELDELDELPDDIILYWRVKAIDRFALETWAEPGEEGQSFGTYYPEPPGVFNLLNPINSALVDTSKVEFSWEQSVDSDPDDSVNYTIWLATSPDFDENLDTIQTEFTNFEIADLMDDHQYWWKVHAQDNNSGGTWSESVLSFNVYIPEILSDFNLIQPATDGPLEPGVIEFTWSNSIDPDPDDSVDYTIYFWDGDRTESFSTGADTLIAVNPDTIEVLDYYWETIWYVHAHSNNPDTSIESDTRNYFVPLDQIAGNEVIIPKHFILFPSHPNPFNNSTTIRFGLPVDADISVNVYNLEGKLVKKIINDRLRAGYHMVQWNTANEASGIYFVRMETDKYINTQKMLLIK
ncbi:MAG: FG-GAP-like repeat-containing protein [Candidatus Electryonea clarkiae]|nr:FG-GAP-like repeat-containing protein [Candidatus Electryonea clarkiae]MDP8287923.1 FG-GAP-like repeat-containing protein [Candidatus Electryonea clarkiae]